jgi:hypothetical protein
MPSNALGQNYGNIFSTTLPLWNKEFREFISKNGKAWDLLTKKNKTFDGGTDLRFPILYRGPGTSKFVEEYETLNMFDRDMATHFSFPFFELTGSFSYSARQKVQNNGGKTQIVNLMLGKAKALKTELANKLKECIYDDGTLNGGKAPVGIKGYISTSPSTGITGGLDRSLAINSFNRNFAYGAVTNGGAAKSATNIRDYVLVCVTSTNKDGINANVGVCDNLDWRLYQSAQAGYVVVGGFNENQLGGKKTFIEVHGVDIYLDGGMDGFCPPSTTYAWNDDLINVRGFESLEFKERKVEVENQNAFVHHLTMFLATTYEDIRSAWVLHNG